MPGINTVQPEPIAQIQATHVIEHAAHALIGDLIRLARRAGRSWYEIGDALDFHGQAVVAKEAVTAAYDNALNYPACDGMRTFTWASPACHQLVTDQGPFCELVARVEGHASGCLRRAVELAEWQKLKQSNEL